MKIDGNLLTTGTGGIAADKYITRTYRNGDTNGPDGSTLTFPITTYTGGVAHTSSSLLVMLNGVVQVGGTETQVNTDLTANYYVDSNGANVVFGSASGDAPLSTDVLHIIELPI